MLTISHFQWLLVTFVPNFWPCFLCYNLFKTTSLIMVSFVSLMPNDSLNQRSRSLCVHTYARILGVFFLYLNLLELHIHYCYTSFI
jgi:hypothetical protein